MRPALRRIILLAAAVLLWSAGACVADGDDSTFLPPPPGTASPFPFCPARPPGFSSGPFPWEPQAPPPLQPQSPPSPSSATVFPQDPGFLPSGAFPVTSAVAWLPLLAVFPAFLVLLQ